MKKVLIIILIFAAAIRLFDLAGNRPHLTNDEAALGYNAYSILKTGRDEHGTLFPVVFKSFGDWKPGLYVYTAVPTIAIFGLNEFATRLPSVIAGVIAVYLIYLLTKKLFKNERIALLSSFFLSISAWHITFSRGAWEANLSLTLTITAIYFFLEFLESKKNWHLASSAIFFGTTLWAYQSAKLTSFLVLVGLAVIYKNKIFKTKIKKLLIAGIVGFVISIPILISLVSGQSGRLAVMSVFSNPRSDQYIEDTITSQGADQESFIFKVFHAESYNFSRGIFGRYFNHFAGRFLFFEGDWANARHTSPDIGYLLLIDAPILLFGLVVAARNYKKKNCRFVLFLLAITPLASALSRDSIHGIRSLNMIIPLMIIMSLGANYLIKFFANKNKLIKYPIFLIFGILYTYNFAFFLDSYFIHGPIADSEKFLYGYKQIVEKITPVQSNYEKIVMNENFDQAYIYYLYYQKYDPTSYQKQDNYAPTRVGDVGKITKLDNIDFRPINWSADKHETGMLIIGRETEFPMYEIENNVDYKFERIRNLDGSSGFVVLEVVR